MPTQFVPANVNVTIERNTSTPSASTGSATPSPGANNTKSVPSVLANGVKNATETSTPQSTEKKNDADGMDVGRALLLVAASFALLL